MALSPTKEKKSHHTLGEENNDVQDTSNYVTSFPRLLGKTLKDKVNPERGIPENLCIPCEPQRRQ